MVETEQNETLTELFVHCWITLHEVARASTMARLMYAAPAWWGYINAGERDRLEGFIRKTKRFGYLPPSALTAEEMSERADDNLFKAVMSDSNHVLHALLPPPRTHEHSLRPRPHSLLLPLCPLCKTHNHDIIHSLIEMVTSSLK